MQNVCEMQRNAAKIARDSTAGSFPQKSLACRYSQGVWRLSPFKDCVKFAALGTAGGKKKGVFALRTSRPDNPLLLQRFVFLCECFNLSLLVAVSFPTPRGDTDGDHNKSNETVTFVACVTCFSTLVKRPSNRATSVFRPSIKTDKNQKIN